MHRVFSNFVMISWGQSNFIGSGPNQSMQPRLVYGYRPSLSMLHAAKM